jgi:glycosyltransferase involved in cell wall biosynthesis
MIAEGIRKIKILHVIATMDPTHGGPIQGVRSYVAEFYKLSFKNEVVCLDDPQKSFLKVDFIVHGLGPCKRPWCYSPKLRPWLKQNLERFDVVLIHGLWLYHGFAVTQEIEALKKQNDSSLKIPKVFVMPHGMLDPYFQKAPGRKLKALRNILYWKLIESKVVNKAEGILFTCEEELLLAAKTFRGYHPKKVLNILYGIESPPSFNASMQQVLLQQSPQLIERQYLLFLSRIHEKKGLDLLIQAFAEVYVNKPGNTEEINPPEFPLLVIAGPGINSQYGKKLKELVAQLNLENMIIFPGMLLGEAKWGAFYGCQSFILPSHQENFGIAVAEALACSKPVLISKRINIWREISNCNAGLMEEDSLEGTKNLLLDWKSLDPQRKKRMGENGRNCYENNFEISEATLRMLRVLV